MVFHPPPATSEDFYAMVILDSVLSGASGMSIFGGGGSNKSSRLYRALVDTELATSISGSLIPTVDPFVYSLSATVRAGRTPAEVEQRLWDELEQVVNEPITEVELSKAMKQAKAQFAYSSESVTGQAFWLGWSEIFAEHTWFERYLETLEPVTREDVQRVAVLVDGADQVGAARVVHDDVPGVGNRVGAGEERLVDDGRAHRLRPRGSQQQETRDGRQRASKRIHGPRPFLSCESTGRESGRIPDGVRGNRRNCDRRRTGRHPCGGLLR